jgi:hypothetical protein
MMAIITQKERAIKHNSFSICFFSSLFFFNYYSFHFTFLSPQVEAPLGTISSDALLFMGRFSSGLL